jgi:hypothetical protein
LSFPFALIPSIRYSVKIPLDRHESFRRDPRRDFAQPRADPVPTPWLKFFFWVYLLFLVGAAATAVNPADPDLWHRLAVGEYLAHTGHFPKGDTFSYLADFQDIADHEWGSALILYGLWSLGGGAAIVLTKIATLAVTLALVVQAGNAGRRPTLVVTGFYAVVLLALLPSFQSTVRCMVFTHLLFALWVYLWKRERRGQAVAAWLYPLTMIAWANLHGGFVIGLFWLALLAVIEGAYGGPWKTWAARLGWCGLATLVNPYGWNLWTATGRALLATRQGFPEWGAVSWLAVPAIYPGYKVLVIGTVSTLAYAIYRRGWKQVDERAVILTGVFLALAVDSARHTSLFAIVAGAMLPGFLRDRSSFSTMARPLRRLTYLCVSAALVMFPLFTAILFGGRAGLILDRPDNSCPVAAVDDLKEAKIRGKLLVPFNYGSYALWELRGQMKVSMDGRYDLVYSPGTYRRVEDFFDARGDWKGLLASPKPNGILVPRTDAVYPKLQAESGWTEAWHDANDAVFLPR